MENFGNHHTENSGKLKLFDLFKNSHRDYLIMVYNSLKHIMTDSM